MTTIADFADLRPGTVDALRQLRRSVGAQDIIRVGSSGCEVDWDPRRYCHRAFELPMLLLTTCIDKGASAARWQSVSFVAAVGTAYRADAVEKDLILCLSTDSNRATPTLGSAHRPSFASTLLHWVDRFGLSDVFEVDRERLAADTEQGQYGVRLINDMAEMPKIVRSLDPIRQLAAMATLALYNGDKAVQAFSRKRVACINPSAVEGFSTLRDGSDDGYGCLLRLIAAYAGW